MTTPNPDPNPNQPPYTREEAELLMNLMVQRQDLLKTLMDPRRDLEAACGYPALDQQVNPELYRLLYERDAIAARIIEFWPNECWQSYPCVYEDEDPDVETPFEKAWSDMMSGLRGESSWYKEEYGNPLWAYMRRADIQCGINTYGLLMLGFDDGADVSQPVKGVIEKGSVPRGRIATNQVSTKDDALLPEVPLTNMQCYEMVSNAATSSTPTRRLIYLRVFPEHLTQILQYESNPTSPRFGQPTLYQVHLTDPRDFHSGAGLSLSTMNVHWTRVLHITDELASSEMFSIPRLRPMLNNVLGLHKIYGCSPEMFYKGAWPGLSLETNPDLGGNVKLPEAKIRRMMEDYQNDLQRYLVLMGMTAKTLNPSIADPTPHIVAQLQAISIKLPTPMRIFMGSERGEMASSQDDRKHNKNTSNRNINHLTPKMIVPFVDRCILAGVLPIPPLGYKADWPDMAIYTDGEKADVGLKRMQALGVYCTQGVDAAMTLFDALVAIGYSEDEATTHVQSLLDQGTTDESKRMPLLSMVGGINAMIQMLALAKEGGLTEEQFIQQVMLFFGVDKEKATALAADGFDAIKKQQEADAKLQKQQLDQQQNPLVKKTQPGGPITPPAPSKNPGGTNNG